jgi:hypothetical protein
MEENDQLTGLIARMAFTHKGCPAIAVRQWGRDCDQMEATNAFILSDDSNPTSIYWPANLLIMLRMREAVMEECREGPCSMTIISEQEYKEFHPTHRDRRAEQYNY